MKNNKKQNTQNVKNKKKTKKVKQRKPMSPRTKENLKNIFGSLISNQRAIDGAKHNPWWMALIFFFVGIMLPVIPVTVSSANSYGASFLNGRTYGFETQLTAATLNLYNDGYEFEVRDDDKVQMMKWDDATSKYVDKSITVPNDETPIYQYINTVTNQVDFQVYYTERPIHKPSGTTVTKTVKDLTDYLEKERYVTGTPSKDDGVKATANEATPSEESNSETSEEVKKTYYRPSYMLIYRTGTVEYISRPDKIGRYTGQGGDYTHTAKGTKLLSRMLTMEGYELPNNASDVDTLLRDNNYVTGVMSNYKVFFNEAYLTTRNNTTLFSSLIFLGIYAVLAFFMGLMIFLLTRGKKNTFNYLKFWTCLKIGFWASVAPAILALILGFMMPSYAVMFFIIFYGMRIMWLSMRQLRPQY